MNEQVAYGEIHNTLDELGAPRGSTTAMRIRGLYSRIAEDAASTLAAARVGSDTAIAERSEFIRQRDEALGRVIATTALIDAAEKREAEALDELNAAEQALTDAAVTDGETLSDRIRELATRAAKYHGALVGANGERDETLRHLRETREVLHREREERATEKATLGAALQALRAETDELGDTVDRLHEENERLAAQLEFAERVLIAGIRRATP